MPAALAIPQDARILILKRIAFFISE